MNSEIKSICNYNFLIKEKTIEYTLFSVVKPENEYGMLSVFETVEGNFVLKEYSTVLKSDLKREKYKTIYFVSEDKINMDFILSLYSETMELLMRTTLKCQLKLTDYIYAVKNRGMEVSEEISQTISELVNSYIMLSEENEFILINKLIQILPSEVKKISLDYIKIENCRLADTQITDKGKRTKVKEALYDAISNNDLFTLAENKDLVRDLFSINKEIIGNKHDLNRFSEEDKIKSLENENKYYDLMTARYERLKESGMISPDITMAAFLKTLGEQDSIFNTLSLDEKETAGQEGNQNLEKNKKVDTEKSYFE